MGCGWWLWFRYSPKDRIYSPCVAIKVMTYRVAIIYRWRQGEKWPLGVNQRQRTEQWRSWKGRGRLKLIPRNGDNSIREHQPPHRVLTCRQEWVPDYQCCCFRETVGEGESRRNRLYMSGDQNGDEADKEQTTTLFVVFEWTWRWRWRRGRKGFFKGCWWSSIQRAITMNLLAIYLFVIHWLFICI